VFFDEEIKLQKNVLHNSKKSCESVTKKGKHKGKLNDGQFPFTTCLKGIELLNNNIMKSLSISQIIINV
jgi:hypothetical protein